MAGRFALSRRWRAPKFIILLFLLEFCVTIPTLALFGIADPDLYRTRLWQDGFDNGFNSSPNQVLYDYANHRAPTTPLVWSSFITNYNVIIAVLSMFILLVKSVMFVMGVWYPVLSAVVHVALLALYAASTGIQLGSDTTDSAHPQKGAPWYITKSCKVAHESSNIAYCQQAKASLAVTIIMLALFLAYLILSIVSTVPSKAEKEDREEEEAELGKLKTYKPIAQPQTMQSQQQWSDRLAQGYLQAVPRTPATTGATAATPRTVAFNTLDGQAAGKGKQKATGKGNLSPDSLPFRERFGGSDAR